MVLSPFLATMPVWISFTVMMVAGITLALLDRATILGLRPLGAVLLAVLVAEEIASSAFAKFVLDDSKSGMVVLLAASVFLIPLAIVYGATKAALFAWPRSGVRR
jgi:hypothetical protein